MRISERKSVLVCSMFAREIDAGRSKSGSPRSIIDIIANIDRLGRRQRAASVSRKLRGIKVIRSRPIKGRWRPDDACTGCISSKRANTRVQRIQRSCCTYTEETCFFRCRYNKFREILYSNNSVNESNKFSPNDKVTGCLGTISTDSTIRPFGNWNLGGVFHQIEETKNGDAHFLVKRGKKYLSIFLILSRKFEKLNRANIFQRIIIFENILGKMIVQFRNRIQRGIRASICSTLQNDLARRIVYRYVKISERNRS